MDFRNIKTTFFALIPGVVESVDSISNVVSGGGVWRGICARVKYERNSVYVGAAITAIGAVGVAMKNVPSVFEAVATVGVGLTCLSVKRLYDASFDFGNCL